MIKGNHCRLCKLYASLFSSYHFVKSEHSVRSYGLVQYYLLQTNTMSLISINGFIKQRSTESKAFDTNRSLLFEVMQLWFVWIHFKSRWMIYLSRRWFITYIWSNKFGLVGLGFMAYQQSQVFKYMISKHILLITFLNDPDLIFNAQFHFVIRMILFTSNHLFTHS